MSTLHEDTIVAVASQNEASKDLAKTVVIRFAKPDEDNPFDWRPLKKWYLLFVHIFIEEMALRLIFLKGDDFNRRIMCVCFPKLLYPSYR